MENDPKEEAHEKSLIAEARRNMEDIARAEAEEAAAEAESSKSTEETSGVMQSPETGAGSSIIPLPMPNDQTIQIPNPLIEVSTVSDHSHQSVSEQSSHSMKSTVSHKDGPNTAQQGTGQMLGADSQQNAPIVPSDVDPNRGTAPDESMMENTAKGIIEEKMFIEDIVKHLNEIHLVEEGDPAQFHPIGGEASNINLVKREQSKTLNEENPSETAKPLEIGADDIIEANRRIQEVDEMIQLYQRIQQSGGIVEVNNPMQGTTATVPTNVNPIQNWAKDLKVHMKSSIQGVVERVQGNPFKALQSTSDDDSTIQRYTGVIDLSSMLKDEAEALKNQFEELDGLRADSSAAQDMSRLVIEKSRIHGLAEISKINNPREAVESSEIDNKVPDTSEITPIPSAPSISEFSNRRFDTSEFSLQTSESLKTQEEKPPESGFLKVRQVMVEPSERRPDADNAANVDTRQSVFTGPVLRPEPITPDPSNNAEQEIRLNPGAIAMMVIDESSEGGTVAMTTAIVNLPSENTLRLANPTNQPPVYQFSPITPTRKPSLLKRLFSKKHRNKFKNDINQKPNQRQP